MARIPVPLETPTHRWDRREFRLDFLEHILYRFHDVDGALLYIGITRNPVTRWRRHRQLQPWWPEVAAITYEVYPREHLALTAEVAAIRVERPRHNIRSAVNA